MVVQFLCAYPRFCVQSSSNIPFKGVLLAVVREFVTQKVLRCLFRARFSSIGAISAVRDPCALRLTQEHRLERDGPRLMCCM